MVEINETLRFQLAPEAQQEIAKFVERLTLLPEDVAQGFFDRFLGLLQAGCLQVSVANGGAASGAGNYVISLRIAGYRELIAAATSAEELYLGVHTVS